MSQTPTLPLPSDPSQRSASDSFTTIWRSINLFTYLFTYLLTYLLTAASNQETETSAVSDCLYIAQLRRRRCQCK